MLIRELFQRDIFRPINGVVKADQLDESSVWQELEEFVVTKETGRHLRQFFSTYLASIEQPADPESTGRIGVWISGFFGSGKSHLLKVLSYLLANDTHTHEGRSRQAVDFFRDKVHDAVFFAEIEKAVAVPTDVILFNIDSKADHRAGRDVIVRGFDRLHDRGEDVEGLFTLFHVPADFLPLPEAPCVVLAMDCHDHLITD